MSRRVSATVKCARDYREGGKGRSLGRSSAIQVTVLNGRAVAQCPTGRFRRAPPSPEGARRKKGVLNKITADIREGAIAGFARHGSNGRGEGGFAGFCYFLAKRHPKAAARIVEKLLPLNVNATGLGGPHIGSIQIVSVPSNTYLTSEDVARIQGGEMPTIEHLPQEIAPEPEPLPEAEPTPEELDNMSLNELLALADRRGLIGSELFASVSEELRKLSYNELRARRGD